MELLVTITIIGMLVGIAIPALMAAKSRADRAVGLSNLRQVGLAIQLYAGDNNQMLPGPLWSGQGVWYNKGDERTLGTRLWSYLNLPEPQFWNQEAKILGSPAYYAKRQKSGSPSYFMNNTVRLADGSRVNPWGYMDGSNVVTSLPMNIPAIASAGISKTWAVRDIDQTWPGSSGAGWWPELPKAPIYDKYRISLNFDMSAELVSSIGVP